MPGIFLSIIYRLKYFFRVRNMKLRGTLPSWILRVPSPGVFIHFFIFSCHYLSHAILKKTKGYGDKTI